MKRRRMIMLAGLACVAALVRGGEFVNLTFDDPDLSHARLFLAPTDDRARLCLSAGFVLLTGGGMAVGSEGAAGSGPVLLAVRFGAEWFTNLSQGIFRTVQ